MLKRMALILSIIYVVFISLFALDSLSDPLGFLMHMLPSLFFISLVTFTYFKPKIGGWFLIVLGVAFTFFFDTYESFPAFFMISFPLFMIGSLFLFPLKYSCKKAFCLIFLELVVVLLILGVYTFYLVGSTIGKTCKELSVYQKRNCLENIYYFFDFTDDMEKKNHLVWVVGNFGSISSAQFILDASAHYGCSDEEYHSPKECISLHTFEDAINGTTSKKNLLAPVWRFLYL